MSFTLIWGGMYLSRPDRSIPPYSVGSQVGHIVATHVPRDTTDQGIETLVKRFRKVGRQTHHFATMKIQPTTPGDPGGWYRQIVVYVFDDDGWAEPEMLNKYLAGDASVVKNYEKAMRGYYRLQDQEEEGGLGPMPKAERGLRCHAHSLQGTRDGPHPGGVGARRFLDITDVNRRRRSGSCIAETWDDASASATSETVKSPSMGACRRRSRCT